MNSFRPDKNLIKRTLIAAIGYDAFLLFTFHFRSFAERLWQSGSVFYALRQFIDPDKLVLDIGANIGYTAAIFASTPSAGVLALEPDRQNFKCLSTALRGAAGIQLLPIGAGAEDGTASLSPIYVSGVKQHALSRLNHTGATSDAYAVSIRSVDSLVAEGYGPVGFVKVDVEGFEVDVLRGMCRTIGRDRPHIFVEICGDSAIDEFNQFVLSSVYYVYAWKDEGFTLLQAISGSGNYLLSPELIKVGQAGSLR